MAGNSVDGNQPYDETCPADATECAAWAAGYHGVTLGIEKRDSYLAERKWQAARLEELLQEKATNHQDEP